MKFPLLAFPAVVLLAAQCMAADLPAPSPRPSASPDSNAAAELQKIEAADDAAQAETDGWVRENKQQQAKGTGVPDAELEQRITQRFEPVRKSYLDFLQHHPGNAEAHLAYGNFLNDRQNERGAQDEWEKALALDTNNAAIYNNLAGRYGESGPVNKAFEFFEKAIQLAPNEAVYYHNFADVLFVLRKPASSHYHTSEQEVYARCLVMYSNALRLDPRNFAYARDLAQTYYSLKPLRTDEALAVWTNTLKLASQNSDREDVYVHMARLKMLGNRLEEARTQLNAVTNESSLQAKASLLKNIQQREGSARRDVKENP